MHHLVDKPRKVAEGHYLLRIRYTGPAPEPGQFVNIKPGTGTDPLLRRPFSVFNYEHEIIEIVVRVVGRGTDLICSQEEAVDMLGPLGKGFTLVENSRALLIGGGVGNAPLYYLAKKLKEKGTSVTMLYGAVSSDCIYCADRFRQACDDYCITTDDGTEGFHGYVTDRAAVVLKEKDFDFMYVCGPAPMMKKTVSLARDIPVEISMENYFGCGIGICSGCTIETVDGNRRACVDGPVFDGKKVIAL